MKLDDLREELRAGDARAEKSVRIDLAKLRQKGLRATGSAMRRLRAWLWVELAVNGLAVLWLGSFAADRAREPRFLFAAIPLHVVALAHSVFAVHQLATLQRLDLAGPLVAIQRRLERLRIGRIRMTKWTFLLAPLLWAPLLVVTLRGVLGVDAYATLDRAWLGANVVFGLAFIPVMLWASRRLGDRFEGSPLLGRVLRDIAGRNLAAAQGFLDELARLEGPDGSAPG